MTDEDWRRSVNARLSSMEKKLSALETESAVDKVHGANVEKRLSAIENTLTRLVWLIIVALGGAFMTFIINGGLASAAAT